MKERYPGIWWQMKNGKCESCGKKTDDLFCTPIGLCNWRCRECQIKLCEAVYGNQPLKDCFENATEWPNSYPAMPDEYVNKRKAEIPIKKKHLKKKHWWSK